MTPEQREEIRHAFRYLEEKQFDEYEELVDELAAKMNLDRELVMEVGLS